MPRRNRTHQKTGQKATPRGEARAQVEILASLAPTVAAWMLGISERVLRGLVDAPRNQDGTYNAAPLIAYWIERLRLRVGAKSSVALEELRRARAEMAKRRNALEAGQIVRAEDAAYTARWCFGAVSTYLHAFSRMLPPKQQDELTEAIERARAQMLAAFPESRNGIGKSSNQKRKGTHEQPSKDARGGSTGAESAQEGRDSSGGQGAELRPLPGPRM